MKNGKLFILTIAAAAFAVSGIAGATDSKGAFTVMGLGTDSCAKFLEEYKDKGKSYHYAALFNWIGGFITGVGWAVDTNEGLGENSDMHAVIHLIREYCNENPLNAVAHAAENVAKQLVDRAGRR